MKNARLQLPKIMLQLITIVPMNHSNVIAVESVFQKRPYAMEKFNAQMLKTKKAAIFVNHVVVLKTHTHVDLESVYPSMSSVMR